MNILIAEDDLNIRLGLQDLLEGEGYTTLLAENGQEAVEQFQNNQPDFILLDIMMPLMDGYSACREIRKSNDDIPIVFISAKSEEIDRVLGLELGADDYIMKPFGTREVVARIRAITRRCLKAKNNDTTNASSEVDDKFSMLDLLVSPIELRAWRDDTMIELSLRDVKILQLLHMKAGQVVTRDDLFNYCWGRDYLPSSRTLDQHISKLRKQVEIDQKEPLIIKTVHGVGYRFDG